MSKDGTMDVIAVGDIFIDLVMGGFSHWPQPGEEVYASDYAREVGGGAAITACGLAELGFDVGIVAVVGADQGDWIVDRLRGRGVDTRLIRCTHAEPTAITVSVSSSEDRAFFTYAGANRCLAETLQEAEVRRHLARARHVHLACALAPDELVRLSRELRLQGCRLSLDVGWHESWLSDPRRLDALREVDLFFPNEREAERLTGESVPEAMLGAFARAGVPGVALKLGSQGAALLWKGEIFWAEPYPVTAVDPTGAGDCFDAGFLAGWLRGQPPDVCLRLGTVCGALSTRRLGGLGAFPPREEVEAAVPRPGGI